jgi:DNA anti-recombination protein RmuC
MNSQSIQLVIVAVVAVTMLLQAIALLAIFNTLRKSAQSMRADVEELRSSVVPVIENLRALLAHTGPKIEAAVTDLAAMSHNLRRQTADIQVAGTEIMERLQKQSQRLDTMLTSVLDGVDRATGFMTDTVTKPMRQLAGLLASAKAVVESLRSDAAGTHITGERARGDKDMFV